MTASKRLRTVELFSGTKSFSTVMEQHGHSTLTIDNNPALSPDLAVDILAFDYKAAIGDEPIDILWASPPCEGFSVAVIGRNWNHDHTPKTDSARMAVRTVSKAIEIIEVMQPKYWFIENPRGKLRKMLFMQGFKRHTVTYCQYGDTRMKPTDIWTNADWWQPRQPCKNGSKCHESAPRGSQTGTQGIKGAKDRGRIPSPLFVEILRQMPKDDIV